MKNLPYKELFILLCILLIGGFLRFYNLNWDEGNFFHPDERNIANAVSRIHFFNQLNPEFFAYGGFFIYLIKIIGDITSQITRDPSWISEWSHINIIGRSIAAFFSTLTIIPLFYLTKSLFNRSTGFIAIVLFAFTVTSIQIAHFGITENLLTFFVILLCFLSIRFFIHPTGKMFFLIGITSGIAIATKTTALSFLCIPAATFLLLLFDKNKKESIFHFPLFLCAFLFSFLFLSPYTFISWDKFVESMQYESGVALGTLPVPYTLQFTNTFPFIFQIENLFWQIGPVFLFSFVGFFLLIYSMVKTKDKKLLIFLLFPVIYFIYVGSWYTKFIRFMLPLIPFFILFASFALLTLYKKIKVLGKTVLSLFLIATIIWCLAFFSIYTRPQTRISASHWMYSNIPSGSKILGEHWDDGLPISYGDNNPGKYEISQLTIYEPDNEEKKLYYAENLPKADYIVINSRRLYGTLLYLPKKYPITSKYYTLLFSEQLGYKKVAEFTSYPNIFGVEINDDNTEETFQVYDHPKVIIFKNTNRLTSQEILNLLNST